MRFHYIRFTVTSLALVTLAVMAGIVVPEGAYAQKIRKAPPEQLCEFRYAEIILNRIGGPGSREVSEAESRWADQQKERIGRGEPCQLPDNENRMRLKREEAGQLASLGDHAGARAILQRLCREDADDVGCQNYGVMAMTGEGGSVDMAEGRKAFMIACEQDLLKACQNYADALLNGEGGPVDDPGALGLYMQLCQKKYGGRNCFRAAKMIEDGRGVTHADRAKAYEGYMAACRQLYTKGCLRATDMKNEGI